MLSTKFQLILIRFFLHGEFRKVVLRWTIRFLNFLKFPGRVQKIILPQMTPTATFFKYIPSKKKIQATLIYFSKALQMKDFCHFCQFSFVSWLHIQNFSDGKWSDFQNLISQRNSEFSSSKCNSEWRGKIKKPAAIFENSWRSCKASLLWESVCQVLFTEKSQKSHSCLIKNNRQRRLVNIRPDLPIFTTIFVMILVTL